MRTLLLITLAVCSLSAQDRMAKAKAEAVASIAALEKAKKEAVEKVDAYNKHVEKHNFNQLKSLKQISDEEIFKLKGDLNSAKAMKTSINWINNDMRLLQSAMVELKNKKRKERELKGFQDQIDKSIARLVAKKKILTQFRKVDLLEPFTIE